MRLKLNKKITNFSLVALIFFTCSIKANAVDKPKVSPKFYDGSILCSRMVTQYVDQMKCEIESITKVFYSWVERFDKSFSRIDSTFFSISTPSKTMGYRNPQELQETYKDANKCGENGDSLNIYFWLLIMANGFLLLCSSLLRLFSDYYDSKLNDLNQRWL